MEAYLAGPKNTRIKKFLRKYEYHKVYEHDVFTDIRDKIKYN